MIASKYWKQPYLRQHFRDGVAAYGSLRYWLFAAGSQLFLTLFLAFPLWFLGRCVLVDSVVDVLEGAFCRPFPFLYSVQWWQFFGTVGLAVFIYAAVYRWTLRQGWGIRLGGYYVNAAIVWAFFFGIGYGQWIAQVMTDTGGITGFGRLIMVFSGPIVAWLWNVHTTLWMKWCAYTMLSADDVAIIVSRVMLQRGRFVDDGGPVELARDGNRLIVTGALDAVSARRWEDLVATSYPEAVRAVVRTTLDDAAYYRHDRDRLVRTRFHDEPLAPPAQVPLGAVVGIVAFFVIAVGAAFVYGPGFSHGITSDGLQAFSARQPGMSSLGQRPVPSQSSQQGREEERRQADIAQRLENTLVVPAFVIDVSASETMCPRLVQSEPQRVFYMDTEHLVGMYMNPGDPTDTTRYGDTVLRVHAYFNGTFTFAFDRRTGACMEQRQYPTIGAAREAAERDDRVLPGAWRDVPTGHDWHIVPPMPSTT